MRILQKGGWKRGYIKSFQHHKAVWKLGEKCCRDIGKKQMEINRFLKKNCGTGKKDVQHNVYMGHIVNWYMEK